MKDGTSGYVIATYLVEDKPESLNKRAQGIAVGLTVGSWTDLPAAKQAAMQPYCGVVEGVEVIGELAGGKVKAHVSIGYPVRNFTVSIPAVLTTVFGKLSMDGKIKLVKLSLPESFTREFPGPKFGVGGLRERFNVQNRPFLMSIFKSCIGNSLDELVHHFREQALGGVDFIKDDEIFFSETHATPEQRVQAFKHVAPEIEGETGKQVAYAVNLTGRTSELLERARRLADLGAGALLFNAIAYGYDTLHELAADPDVSVPIMVHPAVSGALYASPDYGINANIVLGQLMRLAGADIVIYPSAYGSVTLAREDGELLVEALRKENGLKTSLPAPSAGIHPGLVPTLLRDLGNDFIVNAGGAIHGHPNGATAGGHAFAAAISAATSGESLETAAAREPDLAKAIEVWGCPKL